MQAEMKPIIDRMKSVEPMKWVFAGDSITHGALHTWGDRDYTELFSERRRYEQDRGRDIIIKTAISGWNTKLIRNDLDWNILQFNADVVSIMIGMNDATLGPEGLETFRDNYTWILDRIAENPKTHVILHTFNPVWPNAVGRVEHLPGYVEVIRQIAAERKLPLIDHWSYWHNALQEDPIRSFAWMNDSIHPGSYGHRAIAKLLFEELDMWDAKSYVCRSTIP
jgi:lysophospholipase L1-like esterase